MFDEASMVATKYGSRTTKMRHNASEWFYKCCKEKYNAGDEVQASESGTSKRRVLVWNA